jgi:hypothetical protein
MRSVLLIGLGVLLLCTACTDDGKGGAGDAASTTQAGAEDDGRRRRRIELDLQDGAERARAGDAEDSDSEDPSRLAEQPDASPFVVSGGDIVHAIPQDMVIGRLQNRYAEGSQVRTVVEVAERFLAAVLEAFSSTKMEDEVADTLSEEVSPERREELLDWIGFSLGRAPAPEEYRIGELRFDGDDTAWCPVVFRRNGATADGELHLSRLQSGGESARWYVTDLLVQFGRLSDEDNEEMERFEPTEYSSAPLPY